MSVYADSSFIFSACGGKDVHTLRAIRWLRTWRNFPILVSRLTLFEAENAFRSAGLDRRMSAEDIIKAMHQIRRGLLEGLLLRRELPPHQWFPQAHRLSTHGSHKIGARALDILHVVAAKLLRADGFLSFDEQQRKFAAVEGLEVMP